MPASSLGVGATVVKVVSVHPGNVDRGQRTTLGLLHVLDAITGAPLAVVEAGLLTAIRTGAASAVATDLLSRPNSATLGLVGSGFQARQQLEAVAIVRRLERVRVYSPSRERRQAFAVEMSRALDLDVRPVETAGHAVRGADIVCAATTAVDPAFEAADVAPGTHVNGIGSFRLDMGELPLDLLRGARIVVDSREAAEAEAGDLLRGVRAGAYAWSDLAELGELVVGLRPARQSDEEITVFKSVGLAIQDLSVGALVARRAAEYGLGVVVDLGF